MKNMIFIVPQQSGLMSCHEAGTKKLGLGGKFFNDIEQTKIERELVASVEAGKQECLSRICADPKSVFFIVTRNGTILETVLDSEFWRQRDERIERQEPYIAGTIIVAVSVITAIAACLFDAISAQYAWLVPILAVLVWVGCWIPWGIKSKCGSLPGYDEAQPAIAAIPFIVILLALWK